MFMYLELSESMTQPDVFISDKLILNQSVLILQLDLDSPFHILSACHYAGVMQSKHTGSCVSHSNPSL